MFIHYCFHKVLLVLIPVNLLNKTVLTVRKTHIGTFARMVAAQIPPSVLVSLIIRLRSHSRNNMQFPIRIVLFYIRCNLPVKLLETCIEFLTPVLIPHTEIMQGKRRFMPHRTAKCRPLVILKVRAYCKINQIRKIADILLLKLPSRRVRIVRARLAEHAARHNRERHRIQILRQLEILHITKPQRHHITPDIKIFPAFLDDIHRILPIINIIPDIGTFRDTAARKAKESRMQLSHCLYKVAAQTVIRIPKIIFMGARAALLLTKSPDMFREHRNHIDGYTAGKSQF